MRKEQQVRKKIYILVLCLICTMAMVWCSGIRAFATITKKVISGEDYEALKICHSWKSESSSTGVFVISSKEDAGYTNYYSWKNEDWVVIQLYVSVYARDNNGKLFTNDRVYEDSEPVMYAVLDKGELVVGDASFGVDSGDFSKIVKQYGYRDDVLYTLRLKHYNHEKECYEWFDHLFVYDNDDQQIFHYDKEGSVKVAAVKSLKVKNSKAKKVTVSFQKISGAKYEIQYSTNKGFKKGNKTKSVSKNKAVISKLNKGKKYYFRVRAYKKVNGEKVYGTWSSVKSVKIKK